MRTSTASRYRMCAISKSKLGASVKTQAGADESEVAVGRDVMKYAELVGGRLAMVGFVVGVVMECASGKGVGEQIWTTFGPVTEAVKMVALLPSKEIFFM